MLSSSALQAAMKNLEILLRSSPLCRCLSIFIVSARKYSNSIIKSSISLIARLGVIASRAARLTSNLTSLTRIIRRRTVSKRSLPGKYNPTSQFLEKHALFVRQLVARIKANFLAILCEPFAHAKVFSHISPYKFGCFTKSIDKIRIYKYKLQPRTKIFVKYFKIFNKNCFYHNKIGDICYKYPFKFIKYYDFQRTCRIICCVGANLHAVIHLYG